MTTRIVGFDSKRFKRGNFQALLGVGVTISNIEGYIKHYNEIVNAVFDENGLDRKRPIYKAYDFIKLFHAKNQDIPERLFVELSEHITYLDVYYSYFKKPQNKPAPDEFITVFYKERTGSKNVSPLEFINLIEHSYPAVCAWRYLSKYRAFSPEIYSDHFRAHPSGLWNELKSDKAFRIAYKGDQCNYLINAADIFLSAIEQRILDKDLMLNRQIHEILEPQYAGKFETEFIGSKNLYEIAPSNNWVLDISGHIVHPIYFVFPEGKTEFQKIFPDQNENTFLENSAFMDKLYSEATANRGSIKIYDPSCDNPLIKANDVFFYYGPNGKQKIDLLLSLGYSNKTMTATELVKQS